MELKIKAAQCPGGEEISDVNLAMSQLTLKSANCHKKFWLAREILFNLA